MNDPRRVPSRFLISSCRVEEGPAHDRVHVWSRGGKAGVLTVDRGDGHKVAARLLSDEPHLRIEPARQTHIAASVSIERRPSLGDDREKVWVEVAHVGEKDGEPFADLQVMSIVWLEDGRGVRGPDYLVRAWPERRWSSDGPRQIELLKESRREE